MGFLLLTFFLFLILFFLPWDSRWNQQRDWNILFVHVVLVEQERSVSRLWIFSLISIIAVCQALKEFLCYAEGEVRSLAQLYSGVVGLVPNKIFHGHLESYDIEMLLTVYFSSLFSNRVEMLTHWFYTLEKIQLVAHLNKVMFDKWSSNKMCFRFSMCLALW